MKRDMNYSVGTKRGEQGFATKAEAVTFAQSQGGPSKAGIRYRGSDGCWYILFDWTVRQ